MMANEWGEYKQLKLSGITAIVYSVSAMRHLYAMDHEKT